MYFCKQSTQRGVIMGNSQTERLWFARSKRKGCRMTAINGHDCIVYKRNDNMHIRQCCVCKRIEVEGNWITVEHALGANVTHGYCPLHFEITMAEYKLERANKNIVAF
jgi:hypothetical protein